MPGLLRWKTFKLVIIIFITMALVGIHLRAFVHKRSEEIELSPTHDVQYPILKNEGRSKADKNNETVSFVFNGHKFELSLPSRIRLLQNPDTGHRDHQHLDNEKTISTKTPKPITSSQIVSNPPENRFQSSKQTSGTSFMHHYDENNDKSLHVRTYRPKTNMTSLNRHHDVNYERDRTRHDNRGSDDEIKFRFEERNERIREVCNIERRTLVTHGTRGRGRKTHLARDRLSVCLVPKAGTTYLLYQLRKKLKYKKDYKNDEDFDYAHDRKRFFIVREPYGRLVSAYFSKVVSHPKWWVSLGRFIVRKMRTNPSEKSLRCGHDVTFPEFIKYFLFAQSKKMYKNSHFIPIHEVCNPCLEDGNSTKFDFVAHLESMKEEMTYILDSVNVTTDDDFRFNPVRTIVGHFMNSRNQRHEGCGEPWCPIFQRLWWALQSNGHVSTSIPLPLKGGECDDVTAEEMTNIALKAEEQSKNIIDKASQKRHALAELYAQVGLDDRIRVRNALMLDFQLFGYDSQPDFVFSPQEIENLTDLMK